MISESNKNIIKGIAIASVIFGVGYLIASSRGRKANVAKAQKEAENKKVLDASSEIVIEVANPDVMEQESSKDVFAHGNVGNEKVEESKISTPTAPLSENAEDALRWFAANQYNVKPFANVSDAEIETIATKAGWRKTGELIPS